MKKVTLSKDDLDSVADFAREDECLRMQGLPTGGFKARHLKKAMKKAKLGLPLMPSEYYWVTGDGEPLYDMDGGYYHAPR